MYLHACKVGVKHRKTLKGFLFYMYNNNELYCLLLCKIFSAHFKTILVLKIETIQRCGLVCILYSQILLSNSNVK